MDINFAERSHIEYEQKHGRASLIIKGVKVPVFAGNQLPENFCWYIEMSEW